MQSMLSGHWAIFGVPGFWCLFLGTQVVGGGALVNLSQLAVSSL